MKRLLIIGASSFIGTRLALFLEKKYRVWGTYAEHTLPTEKIPTLPFLISEQMDIGPLIDTIRPDAVLYVAAITSISECERDYPKALLVNGLAPILFAKSLEPRNIPFIYLSTSKVFAGDKGNYLEEDPAEPKCLYGTSKCHAEVYLGDYSNVKVIRLGTVFGLGGHQQNAMFNRLLESLWNDNPGPFIEDEWRSFVSVEDICEAVELLLEKGGEGFACYHLAGPERHSYLSFAKRLCTVFGLPLSRCHGISGDEFVNERAGSSASRGKDLTLICQKFSSKFSYEFSSVDSALEKIRVQLYKGLQ